LKLSLIIYYFFLCSSDSYRLNEDFFDCNSKHDVPSCSPIKWPTEDVSKIVGVYHFYIRSITIRK